MRVVLGDDHVMFRDALADALRSAGHDIVGVGAGSRSVIEQIIKHQPDVCLFDAFQSDPGRPDLPEHLAEQGRGTPVILLTAAAASAVWSAVDAKVVAGAVSKHLELDVVETVMRRVLAGECAVEGWPRPTSAQRNQPTWSESLTSREQEVLSFIVEGASTTSIATALGVSTNTVRTHVQNVLHKLGVNCRSKAARVAIDLGYEFDTPDEEFRALAARSG
jgi:two-component system, NarL family, nitrate/nitrite response regulator NarL